MEFLLEPDRIAAAEGGRLLAWVTFPDRGGGIVEVDHTFVDPALRGRGVAAQLMERLAGELSRSGRRARLTCPYAKKWWADHPEYAGLLA